LKHIITTLLILFVAMTTLQSAPITTDEIAIGIQNGVGSKLSGPNKAIIENIYSQTGYKPLWVGPANANKQSELINALNDTLFNYKDKPLGRANIKQLFYIVDNNEVSDAKKAEVYARLDMLLTNSFISLAKFIVEGDVDWDLVTRKMTALKASDDIQAKWEFAPKTFTDHEGLYRAAVAGNIKEYLSSLIPMEKRYRGLIDILRDYRRMSISKIEYTNDILQLGDSGSRVAEIKKLLQASGDYPENAPLDRQFDETMRQAVITYQNRYNLEPDGKVNKVMTYYLNLPTNKNVQQTIANLDKCKLYPKEFENEYIEVNIPDFNLRYYRDSQRLFKTGVVVGRIDRPTPIFNDEITHMVLNPTWSVPDNLVKRDLIPHLREHPEYLKENNIHVFSGDSEIQVSSGDLNQYEHSSNNVPYRFVQFPGDNNALGRIKFMFPNKYDVYLHDTDNKELLERRYKIYSSGCMRVDKPFDLMNILLAHTGGNYTETRIRQILDTMQPTTIQLNKSIPVHIVYFTVYREDGLDYFKNDIYLYDQMIWESSAGHKKATFSLPDKRFIDVQKNAQTQKKPLEE